MNVPGDLRYSKDHEWAREEGGKVRVGITDYAQDALGDVVFVELPPLAGTIVEVNVDLSDAPERLNDDPYGEGWICVIQPDDIAQLATLLDADAYRGLIGS